ncbi:hypothetical protein DB30_03998 [Enhygromyxa salina]|uniref:Uncharacterized protein n=2 Tax=Enhygromyxa salina TaxID=215803 RepID=A0A0C2D0R9_9BACT|nr:hypothetical protein DB30_03998 [Enhygromyxa salina]
MVHTRAARGSARLAALLALLSSSCLGPNPLIDAGGDASETLTDTGDGDGDLETGDGDGDLETGDGDGDGDGDSENCDNAALDPGESDVDCGGPCAPCEDGLACVEPQDCASQVCDDSICATPACDDRIHNGDETDVDCGGPCKFCQHGPLRSELDDFEGSAATQPHVSMFANGSFALTYNGPAVAQARWFDEFGVPAGEDVEIHEMISFIDGSPIRMVAGAGQDAPIHVLESGQDAMSASNDLFLVRRDPATVLSKSRVNPLNKIVSVGDLSLDGSRVTITWVEDNKVLVRRWDYEVAGGSWIDITPFAAEPEPGTYKGSQPVLDRNSDGMVVLGWVRCQVMNDSLCDVVVRRFDAGWIEPGPVTVSTNPDYYLNPQVAIADDGRAGVVWTRLDLDNMSVRARLLDEDFLPIGQQWELQNQLVVATRADVAALSDGSFAYAWADGVQDRVHLRRYVGPDEPKLPDLGDEAPWPGVINPDTVSVSSVPNRLVVVWSGTVDSVSQIQGQVLSF